MNILGHLGCTIYVMTAQLCPSNVKAAMDNVYTSVPECFNKTLFKKQAGGQIWPSDYSLLGVPGGSVVKNPPAGDTADRGSIPGSGRSPGVGNGNPLQYSSLENSVARGAWWATVHRVAESDMTEHSRTHCTL